MDWAFFKKDLQYIFLNQIVSSIPSWTIRIFFYKCSGMKIGPKARIGINTVIISPKSITIGCRRDAVHQAESAEPFLIGHPGVSPR